MSTGWPRRPRRLLERTLHSVGYRIPPATISGDNPAVLSTRTLAVCSVVVLMFADPK